MHARAAFMDLEPSTSSPCSLSCLPRLAHTLVAAQQAWCGVSPHAWVLVDRFCSAVGNWSMAGARTPVRCKMRWKSGWRVTVVGEALLMGCTIGMVLIGTNGRLYVLSLDDTCPETLNFGPRRRFTILLHSDALKPHTHVFILCFTSTLFLLWLSLHVYFHFIFSLHNY